jgi:hypothetical protein
VLERSRSELQNIETWLVAKLADNEKQLDQVTAEINFIERGPHVPKQKQSYKRVPLLMLPNEEPLKLKSSLMERLDRMFTEPQEMPPRKREQKNMDKEAHLTNGSSPSTKESPSFPTENQPENQPETIDLSTHINAYMQA